MADEIVKPENTTPPPTPTADAAAKGDFRAFAEARERAERGEAADPPADKPAAAEEPTPEPVAAEEPASETPTKEPVDPASSEAGKTLAKKKGSLQERINELTHDRYATARERDAARAEVVRLQADLDALKRTAPPKPVEVDPAALPKPKVTDFETYEEFVEALTDWKADQKAAAAAAKVKKEIDERLASEAQERGQNAATRALQEIATQHQTRVSEFKKTHADFDTVMAEVDNEDFVVPPMMREHVLRSDLGPALLYHLAKNPDEFRRIAKMSDGPMLVQLGRLEARLDVATSGPTPAAAPVTQAPKPIKPVGSSATATTVSLRDLATQDRGREFIERRDREERERLRRRA